MKVYIGADHRGLRLKSDLISWLQHNGFEFVDMGAYEYDENDDYSDYGILVGQAVSADKNSRGILICGTGVGICITANKVKNVRAGLCKSVEVTKLARNDDDINVLVLGADFQDNLDTATKLVETFLTTPFENTEKRVRRIEKITNYEQK